MAPEAPDGEVSEGQAARLERLIVGLVRGFHGLRGAVRVEVLTDEPARFEPGSVLHAEGKPEPLTVAWVRPDAPGILVRFEEIATREAAERLRDAYLEIEVPAGALPEGAVYWHEVIGAAVTTSGGEVLGEVVDVFRAGESEVFVVQGAGEGTDRAEVLVPAVRDVIVDFAPEAGRLTVDADALGLEPPRPRRRRGRRSSKEPLPGAPPDPADRPPS
jgi:16S rRNA processing protein RimM